MRRIDVMKKRPSRRPWVLGVVILGLALWGASILLRPPKEDAGPELPVTAADTLPPAAIPLTRGGARAAPEPPSLSKLMPLDEEHLGETVNVEGQVVATGNDAFWILAGSRIIRVDSRRRTRKGDSLSFRGVLRVADGETTDRMAAQVLSREPGSEGWTIVSEIKVVEEGSEDDPEDAEGESESADAETAAGDTEDGA